jgi:hypothetical protein
MADSQPKPPEPLEAPKQIEVTPPAVADMPMSLYANYVSVSNTAWEVTLFFGQARVPFAENEARALAKKPKPRITASPVACISISPDLLDPLIVALTARRDSIAAGGETP